MDKWFGKVGYVMTKEDPVGSGKWKEIASEHSYSGDMIRNNRRTQTNDSVNDNIILSNRLSILSDPFAIENFQYIRYVKFMGAAWKVTSVEMQYPRLILEIGGVYNGKQT